jgi:hypothetical protein
MKVLRDELDVALERLREAERELERLHRSRGEADFDMSLADELGRTPGVVKGRCNIGKKLREKQNRTSKNLSMMMTMKKRKFIVSLLLRLFPLFFLLVSFSFFCFRRAGMTYEEQMKMITERVTLVSEMISCSCV